MAESFAIALDMLLCKDYTLWVRAQFPWATGRTVSDCLGIALAFVDNAPPGAEN